VLQQLHSCHLVPHVVRASAHPWSVVSKLILLLCQVSLEALRWVVLHSLTPLNYVLALEASVWFIERAALEHPKLKVGAAGVMQTYVWSNSFYFGIQQRLEWEVSHSVYMSECFQSKLISIQIQVRLACLVHRARSAGAPQAQGVCG
jgi:hypothetical protein